MRSRYLEKERQRARRGLRVFLAIMVAGALLAGIGALTGSHGLLELGGIVFACCVAMLLRSLRYATVGSPGRGVVSLPLVQEEREWARMRRERTQRRRHRDHEEPPGSRATRS
jgi:hypothetical protein